MHRTTRISAVACVIVLAVIATLLARGQPVPQESFVVTVAAAAEIPASKILQPDKAPPLSLIVSVIGYHPPRAGTVTVVVCLRDELHRTTLEVGRFGIFPNEPFTAPQAGDAQRFGFPIAAEDVTRLRGGAARLIVALEPTDGTGADARLVITAPELAEAR